MIRALACFFGMSVFSLVRGPAIGDSSLQPTARQRDALGELLRNAGSAEVVPETLMRIL